MGLFDALSMAGSGMNMNRIWIDAISDNVANVNTVKPMKDANGNDVDAFRPRYVVADSTDEFGGGGVKVRNIFLGNREGLVVSDPDNPMADPELKKQVADLKAQIATISSNAALSPAQKQTQIKTLQDQIDNVGSQMTGLVRRPDIDMAGQMTALLMAQRGYQANTAVINRAREAYEAAIAIGKS